MNAWLLCALLWVGLLCHCWSTLKSERKWLKAKTTPHEMLVSIASLTNQGRVADVVAFCEEIEDEFGTLDVIQSVPSLYSFQATALYQMQRMNDSEAAFLRAVKHNPNESRAWVNIGEIRTQTFRLTEATEALEKAFQLNDLTAVPRLLRVKGWNMDYKDFELYASDLEKHAKLCVEDAAACKIDSTGGFEYTDLGAEETLRMERFSPHAMKGSHIIDKRLLAAYWPMSEFGRATRSERRVKVGFVSSDFGVHPVSSLIRGALQLLDRRRFEVFCFCLHPQISWWGSNVSAEVDHFVVLPPTNNQRDAAEIIASFRVELLLELNGHTLNTGLNLLAYRPAPLQMTYLGLPTTSGAEFVDYFVGDHVVAPPEKRGFFSEKLLLMKPCYIANDYAQVQGDVLSLPRTPREELFVGERESERDGAARNATLLLGTLSNSQKIDRLSFAVWANLLRRFAGAQMVFHRYAGHKYYLQNLDKQMRFHGVAPHRFHDVAQKPWIDHLASKNAFDLLLDTLAKNGHTTGLDGVWAGVPTVTFGGAKDAQSRAGQSIAAALHSSLGVAFSLKEYEDIAVALLTKRALSRRTQRKVDKAIERQIASLRESEEHREKEKEREKESVCDESEDENECESESERVRESAAPPRATARLTRQEMLSLSPDSTALEKWRAHAQRLRNSSDLFNTRAWTASFERLLEAAWEAHHITSRHGRKPFHLFAQVALSEENERIPREERERELAVQVQQIYSAGSRFFDRPGMNIDYSGTGSAAPPSESESEIEREKESERKRESIKDTHEDDDSQEEERRTKTKRDSATSSANNKIKNAKKKVYPPIPQYVFDGRLIFLNIGGMRPAKGWLNVNAQLLNPMFKVGDAIDIRREMHDLKGLPNNSVSALYTSHTLEHVPMGNGMVNRTLTEWHRVLRPGGLLLISVPDLENIARMFLDPKMTVQDRWFLTNVLFGGQQDEFDFHHFGYSADILTHWLKMHRFCEIKRVGPMNMAFHDGVGFFSDSSDLVYKGYLLSLNVAAKVCPEDKPEVDYDQFEISGNHVPFMGHLVSDYPRDVQDMYFTEGKFS